MLRKIWHPVDRVLSAVEVAVVLSLLTATLLLAFSQVLLRWLGGGWTAADELVRYFVLWMGIWGAGPATRHGKHIAIDVAVRALPGSGRRWIRRATDLLGAALAYALYLGARNYIAVFDDPLPSLPVSDGQMTWPVAVGFLWIAIRFLADAILGGADEEPLAPLVGTEEDLVGDHLGESPAEDSNLSGGLPMSDPEPAT